MTTNPTALVALLDELREKREPLGAVEWHLEHCDDWMAMNMYAIVDDPKEDYDMAGMGKGCADHIVALTLYQADGPSGGGLATHPMYQQNTEHIAAHSPAAMSRLDAMVRELIAENEWLMRGEFICRKCGLRKDSEPCDTGGHF